MGVRFETRGTELRATDLRPATAKPGLIRGALSRVGIGPQASPVLRY